jgi:hypothetical protein
MSIDQGFSENVIPISWSPRNLCDVPFASIHWLLYCRMERLGGNKAKHSCCQTRSIPD